MPGEPFERQEKGTFDISTKTANEIKFMAETTSSVALLNRMRNELVTRQSTLREDGPVDEEVNDAFLVIDAKLDELEAIDRVIQEMEFQFQPTDQDPSQNN